MVDHPPDLKIVPDTPPVSGRVDSTRAHSPTPGIARGTPPSVLVQAFGQGFNFAPVKGMLQLTWEGNLTGAKDPSPQIPGATVELDLHQVVKLYAVLGGHTMVTRLRLAPHRARDPGDRVTVLRFPNKAKISWRQKTALYGTELSPRDIFYLLAACSRAGSQADLGDVLFLDLVRNTACLELSTRTPQPGDQTLD